MDFLSFNWGMLVFLFLLIIAELVDIKMLNEACDLLKEFSRGHKLDPEDKSELIWLLIKSLFCTAAVVGGILCFIFFIVNHL